MVEKSQGSVASLCFVFRIIFGQLVGQASVRRVAHRQHMDRVASDREEHAVHTTPLSIEQHPDFFAIDFGIRIDRAALRD